MAKYTLPSGLASCEFEHPLGTVEWSIPLKAADRNKALEEALHELAKLQQATGDKKC